jgi:very-short-patch-repair endonuclease
VRAHAAAAALSVEESSKGRGAVKTRGAATEHAVETARSLRHEATSAEKVLWQVLRDRRLAGVKFRRQHPFDHFILDFFCVEHQLAIEIDGGVHSEIGQQSYDEARTEFLQDRGVRVVRFRNEEVLNNLDGVVKAILDALA